VERSPRRITRAIVCLALAVLAGCARAPGRDADREVARRILDRMEHDAPFTRAITDSLSDPWNPGSADALVGAFYRARHGHAVWIREGIPSEAAGSLINALQHAADDGLDPAVYDERGLADLARRTVTLIADTAGRFDALARLDVRLTLAWLALAGHRSAGRVPYASLDPDWGRAPSTSARLRELPQVVKDGRVPATLATFDPQDPEYRRLLPALALYRAIDAGGGWPPVGAGPDLRRGAGGERVARLQRHLRLTGDLARSDSAGTFGKPLDRAVREFQTRHGLPPTGVVDAATQKALDVPSSWRVRQLELNLERWRWIHIPLQARSVRVNIPDFTVALWDSGRVMERIPVVVGRRQSPTPVFSDLITYLEVNPTWRLPKNVLADEVLPAAARDTAYFRAHQLRVFYMRDRQPREVPPSEPDWTTLWDDTFPYLVIQDPGPDNPLGMIKFMCPNEYDVYLHDSNAPGLFGAPRRAYSHGCVRVGKPMDLAAYVLGDTSSKLALVRDSLLVTHEHRLIRLDHAVPVHVLYRTAWVDSTGIVEFRNDVYGYDAQLDSFLVAPRTRTWTLNPDSLRTAWRAQQRRERALAP